MGTPNCVAVTTSVKLPAFVTDSSGRMLLGMSKVAWPEELIVYAAAVTVCVATAANPLMTLFHSASVTGALAAKPA